MYDWDQEEKGRNSRNEVKKKLFFMIDINWAASYKIYPFRIIVYSSGLILRHTSNMNMI
jgi:hypothetical protein